MSWIGSPQIRLLSPFAAPSEYFAADGVHLKKDAGIQFIQFVIHGVDQVFPVLDCSTSAPPPSSSLMMSDWASSPPSPLPASGAQIYPSLTNTVPSQEPSISSQVKFHPSTSGRGYDQFGAALTSLTRLHHVLSQDVQACRDQDNLIFARIKEDLDFECNKNRENRFTLSGLKPKDTPPTGAQE